MRKDKSRDFIRIEHMINAIEEISIFIKGKSQEVFEKDRILVLAVIKEIEIIGEAASKISEEFKREYSHIPWDMIISTRHRLIHGYFDIDESIIWDTFNYDIVPLKEELEKIINKK